MVSIAETITFPEILEKPEITPQDTTQALVTVGLLVVLILVFLAPLIYFPIRNKRDKKQKALLTERLTEYHKTHGNNETIAGEMLFANSTECTKEAIHTFSIYQAYIKSLGTLVVGALLCLVTLVISFLVDAEWWLKLLTFGVVVYYGYKIVSAPHTLEKIQRRVFDRGVSSTAHYAFYDGFRVSGLSPPACSPISKSWTCASTGTISISITARRTLTWWTSLASPRESSATLSNLSRKRPGRSCKEACHMNQQPIGIIGAMKWKWTPSWPP